MFAFRIIVDIALKALSPAINDPTTAMLLDQVHRLLRMVGQRKLRGEVIVDGQRAGASHLPHPKLGTLRSSRLQRDSRLRRGQLAGRAPHARDAREPPQDAAGTPPRRAGHRTRLAGLGDPNEFHPSRGTRAGPYSRFAGVGGFDEGGYRNCGSQNPRRAVAPIAPLPKQTRPRWTKSARSNHFERHQSPLRRCGWLRGRRGGSGLAWLADAPHGGLDG